MPVRCSLVFGMHVPGTAANRPDRARTWTPWVGHSLARIGGIPVVGPLPHVAKNVVQAPDVRELEAHPMC